MRNNLEKYSDTVLYDVFYEAGTMLGGWLVDLRRKAEAAGDTITAQACSTEIRAMDAERLEVNPDDRAAQIAFIHKCDARREEIDSLAYAENCPDAATA